MSVNYELEPEYTSDGSRILYEVRTFTETTEGADRQLTFPHTNSLYEIVYPKEAGLRFQIEQGDFCELREEDIILIFPHVIHSSFLPLQTSPVTRVVQHVLKFTPAFLYPQTPVSSDIKHLLVSPNFPIKYKVFRKGTSAHHKFFYFLRQLEEEYEAQAPGTEIALRGLFSQIYAFILREMDHTSELPADKRSAISGNSSLIFKAITYMEEHFADPLSMQQLAAMCNVNYYYFSRLFKHYTHSDFRNYLLTLRLNEAKRRLLQTDASITTIAMECGFTATSHFIQKFHNSTGITPLEFRKQYRTQ